MREQITRHLVLPAWLNETPVRIHLFSSTSDTKKNPKQNEKSGEACFSLASKSLKLTKGQFNYWSKKNKDGTWREKKNPETQHLVEYMHNIGFIEQTLKCLQLHWRILFFPKFKRCDTKSRTRGCSRGISEGKGEKREAVNLWPHIQTLFSFKLSFYALRPSGRCNVTFNSRNEANRKVSA